MDRLKLLDMFQSNLDLSAPGQLDKLTDFREALYEDRRLKGSFALDFHASLENVYIVPTTSGEQFVAWGNIFGDVKGRFPDGMDIRTSAIQELVYDENHNCYIVTFNTVYKVLTFKEKPSA